MESTAITLNTYRGGHCLCIGCHYMRCHLTISLPGLLLDEFISSQSDMRRMDGETAAMEFGIKCNIVQGIVLSLPHQVDAGNAETSRCCPNMHSIEVRGEGLRLRVSRSK